MQCACAILPSVDCPTVQYFSTLSHKKHDFPPPPPPQKKNIEPKMCVLIFLHKSVWNVSHYKNNWARYDHKCAKVFMWCTRCTSTILMKLESSWQIFQKYLTIKFYENPSSGSRVVPCGRTDRQTDMTKLSSQVCESIWKMKPALCPKTKR
jgi:hypothetical protein